MAFPMNRITTALLLLFVSLLISTRSEAQVQSFPWKETGGYMRIW